MECFSFSFSNPSLKIFPIFSEFSTSPSSVRAFRAAVPAAHDSGLPPKVEECSPLLMTAKISGLTSVAPIGTPPAIPFARHMMSGEVSQCSQAHNRPVLPNPACISSKIRRIPFSSHSFRTSCKNPSCGTIIPLSP